MTATRDCRAPGIAHRTLPLGSLVRFISPGYLRGKLRLVTRRPGWVSGSPRYAGHASVFYGPGIATRYSVRRTPLSYPGRQSWWFWRSPNGVWALHVQRDWGPGIMHRVVDLSAASAGYHGYSYAGFPTDQGRWRGWVLGFSRPSGLHEGTLPRLTAVGICRFGSPGARARVSFQVLRAGPRH
jgi:hypothetical protein